MFPPFAGESRRCALSRSPPRGPGRRAWSLSSRSRGRLADRSQGSHRSLAATEVRSVHPLGAGQSQGDRDQLVAGAPVPIEEYDNLYKRFNPVKFNADQWARVAKEAGMKYVVLHHEAPRRLLPLRYETDRLQHHAHAVRPGRDQGVGRGVPDRASIWHVLFDLRLAPSRLSARQPGRARTPGRTRTWIATSNICASRWRS